MQLGKLCELFGIGKCTATAKARSIEKLMGISYLDPRWSLPSRLDDNPLVWMLTVNGFAVDMRTAPLELQEEAFRLGLIPNIPGMKMECSQTVSRSLQGQYIMQLELRNEKTPRYKAPAW